ncbi:ABC transporter permease [Brucella sp. NBRC 12950]|uniref:ABC transporter permease n=1 Tax=Brucella sp. NBRC 12950 TaxID=2994518 RepID=UPI0024A3AD1E|nr:ABC transporter permease [Brucella sp. NBRC 12950]GLU29832.1 spermidine/putrescine ABC transporter permease [Brucella sp. NBRC 12950]
MRNLDAKSVTGLVLASPAAIFTIIFFLVPAVLLFVYSFWLSKSFTLIPAMTLENYTRALMNPGFYTVLFSSLKIGVLTAIVAIGLSFPVAMYIVYRSTSNTVLYLILASWLSSYLVRIYGWRMILGSKGLINTSLLELGVIKEPLEFILYNSTAVIIALVHVYIPVALLLLVSALRDVKSDYLDAARDLGASGFLVFTKVIMPMIHRGFISAFMFTLILAAGDFVTPQLLGGRDGTTVGVFISNQFRQTGNWPFGAAMAFIAFFAFAVIYVLLVQGLRLAGLAPFKHSKR